MTKTILYFIRHCQPDMHIWDDMVRTLTCKGLADRQKIEHFFEDKTLAAVWSSPYIRAVSTVKQLADLRSLSIKTDFALRERDVIRLEPDTCIAEIKKRWENPDCKSVGEESFAELEIRAVSACQRLRQDYQGQSVAIGSHGSFLSSLIRYYEPEFNTKDYFHYLPIMPWIAKFEFEGEKLLKLEKFDLMDSK